MANDPGSRTAAAAPEAPVIDYLARELERVVGSSHVLLDPGVKSSFETDWTRRFSGRSACVVRPGSTEEVAGVLRVCAAVGTPVVPQGGNTGLVGASVPRGGEVLLSLTRLNDIEPVDAIDAQVTAGAGVTLAALQAHARGSGFEFPVDHAARDSATVGGMVATNAGGVRVLRYGTARANVVGLEAVLANGQIIRRMSGLVKDNVGYDLPGLLVGSEGTLGVITKARLRLVPALPQRTTALVAVDSTNAALDLFARLRAGVPSLEAVEIFYRNGLELVREHTGAPSIFAGTHPTYLLVECAAQYDPVEELTVAIGESGDVLDAAVAQDSARRTSLWSYRERHSEAINAQGIPHKLDVTLPLSAMVTFEEEVRSRVAETAAGSRTILFGHLGDGNVHVNILGINEEDGVDETVLRLVAELGGSISAEHGVGVAKARWLTLGRSPEDIEAMGAIKRALDPNGLLNPGVLFASHSSPSRRRESI
ncbi:MAG: FAD-binding oxidoreductase [Actinomycetota bacterium]